jgi:hypothetical protein
MRGAGMETCEFIYGAGAGYAVFIRLTVVLEFAAYYNRPADLATFTDYLFSDTPSEKK